MDFNIGERIAHFRTAKGFSVNYLANQAGISQSYLREIELGRYSNPSVDTIETLCSALGISLREFFDTGTTAQNTEDSLLEEISALSLPQCESLRIFLKSLHSQK